VLLVYNALHAPLTSIETGLAANGQGACHPLGLVSQLQPIVVLPAWFKVLVQ
jgi:hypothetical protein